MNFLRAALWRIAALPSIHVEVTIFGPPFTETLWNKECEKIFLRQQAHRSLCFVKIGSRKIFAPWPCRPYVIQRPHAQLSLLLFDITVSAFWRTGRAP
jgi:hypothetical protein